MSRSSVLLAFVVLASLAGCAPENAPVIAARTELLDGGIIATASEWYVDGWCDVDRDCRPLDVWDYPDGVVDDCFDYECRVFEYMPPSAEVGNNWGRCFVRKNPAADVMCRFDPSVDIRTVLMGSKIGIAASDVIESYVRPGMGRECFVDSDDPSATPCPDELSCVDGVCCESACDGGTNDCFACSVAAGGAMDGLCTPTLTHNTCTPATACTENARCIPSTVGAAEVFSGVCEGTSTAGREIAGEVCCIDDSHCPDDSDGDKCTVPVCVANRCIEKLAYEGCCVSNAECEDDNPCTVDSCVETPRIGQLICQHTRTTDCDFDAGVEDASVSTRDLGEWRLDGSNVDDAEIDRDGEIARDAATRMDGQVDRDARIDDADVVIDAEVPKDAEMPDASADAAAIPVTPIFRGGGGIRCAVSSAPGSDSGGAGLAGAVGLSMIGLMLSRRRRR